MSRKPTKPKINIFEYDQFRDFLRDFFQEKKILEPDFTMRILAQKAGFGSPSFFKMIVDGKRRLSDESRDQLLGIMNLGDREQKYFVTLVNFAQCENPDQKNHYSILLSQLRPKPRSTILTEAQRKYLACDYYACIREMVLLNDFCEDAKWIAAHCLPRIKPQEAREAIDVLLELKLLARDAQGKLIQTDPVVDTGFQAQSIEAFQFHEAVLNKARKYLSLLKQENRSFQALTIPVPTELEAAINQRIDDFQKNILELINQSGLSYHSVYQLNIQFFPVTEKIHEAPDKPQEETK